MQPGDPFDLHPASVAGLEQRARELVSLAEQAGDQQAVTDRAFRPAVASWEGVAAPELRAAPVPVRQRAGQVASQLSWAAVPLRFWAEQVRQFNAKVGQLRDRWAQVPAEVERHLREAFGEDLAIWPQWELDLARLAKRRELVGALEGEWHAAFVTHIDEGERTVVRMLRHGPTWENVQLAGRVGAIPGGPMLEFFTARWSRTAALAEADRIAGLVVAGSEPTQAELELLGELLSRYAGDPEFAYLLLTGLGPAGLLAVTGRVGLLGREGSGDAWHRTLGVVQRGLAVALATGTLRRGTGGGDAARTPYRPGEFELTPEWVHELTRAGRQQVLLGVPPAQLYGYQPLGVLLGHGRYDHQFLSTVGGDMIDFELERGGSGFWAEGVPELWMRLDWVDGHGPTAPAGFDPMIGLLEGLAENPEAARDVFTSRMRHDESGVRLPRLDYLLTDREWPVDRVPGTAGLDHPTADPSRVSPGIPALGAALEAATTSDPDERSYRIVESIIYEIAHDEQALGYPNGQPDGPRAELFRDVDIVRAELRPFLGRIGAFYIDDLHWGLAGREAAGADIPNDTQLRHAGARELQVFLAELGKDPEATATVTAAEFLYSDLLYQHYLTGWNGHAVPELLEAHAQVASPMATLVAALDFGAASELRGTIGAEDAAHNEALRGRFFWAGLAGSAVNAGPYDGGPVGYLIRQGLDHLNQSLSSDSTGAANYYVGDLKEVSRQALRDLIERAAYESLTRELSPGEFLANVAEVDVERVGVLFYPDGHPRSGEFIPMEEWGDAQRAAWDVYITTKGNGGPAVLVDAGLNEYNTSFETARGDLEGDSHTGLPK